MPVVAECHVAGRQIRKMGLPRHDLWQFGWSEPSTEDTDWLATSQMRPGLSEPSDEKLNRARNQFANAKQGHKYWLGRLTSLSSFYFAPGIGQRC